LLQASPSQPPSLLQPLSSLQSSSDAPLVQSEEDGLLTHTKAKFKQIHSFLS